MTWVTGGWLLRLPAGSAAIAAATQWRRFCRCAVVRLPAPRRSQVLGVPVAVISKNSSSFDGIVLALEQAFQKRGQA